jgi:hypothetical protein
MQKAERLVGFSHDDKRTTGYLVSQREAKSLLTGSSDSERCII